MTLEIEDNAALVTASSSGLGRACAEVLVKEGANVVINGRDGDRLMEAAEAITGMGSGQVVPKQGDLTKAGDIEALVETTVDEFGGMDHLITSAGGPPSGRVLDLSDEDWYAAFDLLVMSVVRLVRSSAPYLRENGGGTIVNITSGSVKEAMDALVLSNSVRMSVVGLEKTLSKELAPEIRSNTVLPSSIETSRVRNLISDAVERGDFESYDAGVDARTTDIPMGQLGEPRDLGETVAFLCSPKSKFVNGAAIPVDGGKSASTL